MDPFIGQITIFAGNYAPEGWLFCQGQLLPINDYQVLFAVIGTIYGGDGVQTFQLPDLRGRAALHAGQGPGLSQYTLGQTGGSETVTLIQTQLPQHTHTVAPGASSNDATQASPSNAVPASTGRGGANIYTGASNAAMAAVNSATAGGNQPHANIQPYLAMNYIIAWQGIFPSQN